MKRSVFIAVIAWQDVAAHLYQCELTGCGKTECTTDISPIHLLKQYEPKSQFSTIPQAFFNPAQTRAAARTHTSAHTNTHTCACRVHTHTYAHPYT